MAVFMNPYPKKESKLSYFEARWLYDMGMHETLWLKDNFDWAGGIFDKRKELGRMIHTNHPPKILLTPH